MDQKTINLLTQKLYTTLMDTSLSMPVKPNGNYAGVVVTQINPTTWIAQYINATITYTIREGRLKTIFPGGNNEDYQN